jgi:predicted nucleotidyltransferase component of viral defense system
MPGVVDNPILTVDQKRFLRALRESPLAEVYYLTGGTALSAFYLEHRQSEDLDFFSGEAAALEMVLSFIHSLPGVTKVQFDRKFDRRIFLLELADNRVIKTEFTRYPFPRLEKETVVEGILIDSFQDILVNKIVAMTDRIDAKDYVDLYCAIRKQPEIKIERLIEGAEKKFGVIGVGHIIQGRFLGDIPSSRGLHLMESIDPEQFVSFFRSQAKAWIARLVAGPEK